MKKLYSEATGMARDFVNGYWQKAFATASSVKDSIARWERLLTLAVQVPTIKEQVTHEIQQSVLYLPPDFIERISNQLKW